MGEFQQTVYGCETAIGSTPTSVLLPGHDVPLGRYLTVRRLLPQRTLRTVGAWCFVDHFGPTEVTGQPGMRIPPHPHTGLQTVTWLVEGVMLHRDSVGSLATIRPGEVNVMTSGHGITHSEEAAPDQPTTGAHGLQLWVALPESARHGAPRFEHRADLPELRHDGVAATVLVGALGPVRSPVVVHTPLVGAEVLVEPGADPRLPLDPSFEYAVLVMAGAADVAGTALEPGALLYLSPGRAELTLGSAGGARLFLLGGEPFEESLVMWWNFVGRSHEEIAAARDDWRAGRRFGRVEGFDGDPLPAPELPTVRLKARDRTGGVRSAPAPPERPAH